jgi:hypothetical protein
MAASDQAEKVATTKRSTPSKKAMKEAEQRLKQAQRASILLKQVSDPTRLQVVLMLSDGEKHVGGLCEQLSQSQPAVSHHLALLRHGERPGLPRRLSRLRPALSWPASFRQDETACPGRSAPGEGRTRLRRGCL